MKKESFRVRFSYLLLSVILFFYAIIVAKDFLYPIAFSVLLAYLIYPFVNFLEKKKFSRILAILFSLIIIIVFLYFAGSFIYGRLEKMITELPALKKQALINIETVINNIEKNIPIGSASIGGFLQKRVSFLFESGGEIFNKVFTATTGTLLKILLLPVYIFLFLFYRTKFAHFILMITPYDKRLIIVRILRDISKIASKYMAGALVVVIILAILNSIGLLLIGVRYAILIGILSGLLAFIPYFGSILGGILAFSFALLTSSNPIIAIKVALFYIIIVFSEHNILTPNIVGNNLRINPFIIILSLLVAGTVWGVPGLLVIVPFMAFLKIIAKYYPGLQSYSFLLGMRGTKKHAIYIPTLKEIIQRKKENKSEED